METEENDLKGTGDEGCEQHINVFQTITNGVGDSDPQKSRKLFLLHQSCYFKFPRKLKKRKSKYINQEKRLIAH